MTIRNEHETRWTFLTNHAHVLLCLATSSSLPMRNIAEAVGITERAVQQIISDLDHAGYIKRSREGRCNTYSIQSRKFLRHPLESHRTIDDLIRMIGQPQNAGVEGRE